MLRPDGHLLRVVPMERHLWELKAAVYDTPYENPPADLAADGFTLVRQEELRRTITLTSQEDIQALFQMTPYYYKTGADDQRKLEAFPDAGRHDGICSRGLCRVITAAPESSGTSGSPRTS